MSEKQPEKPTPVLKLAPPTKDMTDREVYADALLLTPVQAAKTVTSYLQPPFNDCVNELTKELHRQVKAVNKGDMTSVEGLLVQQAHTLSTIFNRLAQRAQVQEDSRWFELFLKLALRAQAQCARTLEVLSAVKNPPNVAFVKQANIAHNQQVNNGTQAGPPAAHPPVIDQPKLEQIDGNYLDSGTATTAVGNDPAMATVGENHRPKDHQGQG